MFATRWQTCDLRAGPAQESEESGEDMNRARGIHFAGTGISRGCVSPGLQMEEKHKAKKCGPRNCARKPA